MGSPLEEILAGVNRRYKRKSKYGQATSIRMNAMIRPEEWELIDRAAAQRGISRAGFARFAVTAFACHVMGIDYYEFMHDLNIRAPGVYGHHDTGNQARIKDGKHGKGGGPWKITGLKDWTE